MADREGRSGRILHLDCFSGIAGNMWLGALLDLGVSAKKLRAGLRGLGIDGLRMQVSKVMRKGISATHVSFRGPAWDAKARHYTRIRHLLERADLEVSVREFSLATFDALASVEAKIHGVDLEQVHFHELGSVDTLGDIVGVHLALWELGVDRITASEVALGSGTVETEHGVLPLPAPATLALLSGIPTYPAPVKWETVTPTGAALLATRADDFGPMPALSPERQGFGAGNDRAGPMPNVVRAILGASESSLTRDRVSVIETHLDDMQPEALPFLLERLMDAGALDASLTALAMKKGRPGQLLRVIVRPADRDRLARRILAESTSLGVRFSEMARWVLERETRLVQTEFGRIRVKFAIGPDGRRGISPEFESCARAARRHDVALLDVYRAAEHAALSSE